MAGPAGEQLSRPGQAFLDQPAGSKAVAFRLGPDAVHAGLIFRRGRPANREGDGSKSQIKDARAEG